jgi:hypothetical protein
MSPRAQVSNERQPVPPVSSVPSIGIHVTREELRAKRWAELAQIFESAFEVPQ